MFVSSSEGMHRLGGSGGSSQSDGGCADPAPMMSPLRGGRPEPDGVETTGISLCGAHAAICSSNADWLANSEKKAPSDAGSKPGVVHDAGCSSTSHCCWPPSSVGRWVAAGASGWAKMSPAVIWTAPSPGKADDEGRDCGVACPWTETETDREPCDPAEARMGDGCGRKITETSMQSGERGEVRLGDKQDNREKREAFDADSRKLGERSDYFINIGSTIIRVGSVKSNLQRHG